MTEEKKTSIFGKLKKAITAENCSCCCNVKIVPEKSCCDEKNGETDCCKENCCGKSE
ncbi:MAG: hypothetical protein ALMCE001_04060 [Methanocorpusculum sp. MCE]|jgi:hypothetical protein|nr:hypothetical protein [Massilibacteroides sp.]MEA5036817.1 hypothetical protein [Methanocorpusculum sp.]RBQ25352.1 MAG: hypothetical protein ALMCE001_04060 [Methanocorpusculum sp. MCE]